MNFWNCRSLCSERIASDLAETFFARQISTCALAETHLRGEEKAEMNGYELLNSGVSMSASKTQAGVGLAYNPAKVKIIDSAAVSEKNAVAWLIAKDTRLQVVATPFSPQKTDEKKYMQYLQELKDACKLRPSKVKSSSELQLLIPGDLNATLGKEIHEHLPKQVGRFLPEEESSRNGELMTEIVTELGLRVNNSFFKKKETKKMSWRHPRTGKLSLMDYCLSPMNSRIMVQDLKFSWRDSQHSDHAMLILLIRDKLPQKPRARYRGIEKNGVDIRGKCDKIFRTPKELEKFRTKVKATTIDPAKITETLRQIIEEQQIDERSDFHGSSRASHLTSAEIETLQERKSVHKRYLASKCPEVRVKRDVLNRKVKKITSDCKDHAIESRLKSYEHLQDTQDIKNAFKSLKETLRCYRISWFERK